MTDNFLCIHGHFYQPPRENPWLDAIEYQPSARPYHDWNERVTAECYLPNASSRILDQDGYITGIVNNYARISFNFGPTLLTWLETGNPGVYRAILEADRQSRERFSGHGSALAQAYNHMIMPLADRRDRYTQVLWGIRDFEHRFQRKPEGMWLPETAVDLETLDILAEQGIRFTILAPHQAKRVRQIGTDAWNDVGNATIDPTMAYELNLPSGRKISLFFYDGPIARTVAFEDLLIQPGDRIGVYDALFTLQAYGPILAIAAWHKSYKEPIYLVTNMDLVDEACYWYRKRFRIETFFSDQKTRGFHLNKSHIADPVRLSRLMISACLAYIWIIFLGALALLEGWVAVIHRTDRCDLSLFQIGLRLLDHFLNERMPIPVAFQMLELGEFV